MARPHEAGDTEHTENRRRAKREHSLNGSITPNESAVNQEQPAANLFRKHWKSLAVNWGDPVEPSQLA